MTPDELLLEFFTFYLYEFDPLEQMIDLSSRKRKPVIPRECSEMLFHYTCKPKNQRYLIRDPFDSTYNPAKALKSDNDGYDQFFKDAISCLKRGEVP